MAKQFTDEDDDLLARLGVEVQTKKLAKRTPTEGRIIAGFEEIQRFFEEHGRAPSHGDGREIFERLYAVRLDRLRELGDCRTLLEPLDYQGLLSDGEQANPDQQEDIDDDTLLEELGVEAATAVDITQLRHVRSSAEKRAAEEIANRERCEDFEKFKPLFEEIQSDLTIGMRETRPFQDDASIAKGDWFILSGLKVYVADIGDEFVNHYGRTDRRLRVIFANGTESNMLKRSLERALQKDEKGRRITNPSAGPLFSAISSEDDQESGTVYVLRSKSDHPSIMKHRDILHKIGVTGGSVEKRIANATKDPTFLLAGVEIVATYKLYNINRTKLENLIHRIFDAARLDIEIKDRFGQPVVPREWFLVPLSIIDETIAKIQDNTIAQYRYDVSTASFILIAE